MSKRRYNAKKVAKAPLLKKTIAILLAEHAPRDPQINLTNMLAYGHRGYISLSEDELCKMFDKTYLKITEEHGERIKKLQEEQSSQPSYLQSRWQHEIEKLQTILKQFQSVADEIFEQKVLL